MKNIKNIKLNLIYRDPNIYGNQPCFDVMKEFEDTICNEHSIVEIIKNNHSLLPSLNKLLVARIGIPIFKIPFFKKNSENYFSIQMGPDFGKVLPFCYLSGNTYAYFFDIWPKFFDETEKFLKNSSINQVFFSSLYATIYFKEKGFNNVTWIPEGVSSQEYKYDSFEKKDIDVLELGRKYKFIHDKIVGVLSKNNKTHFYEKEIGKSVFFGKESFISGMARSKISICFPKSETHPEVAGPVSTMTNRYLQSMASKCLVVGSESDEMKYLFDYPAVVHLNTDNPADHLLEILDNYDDYQDLIEKNYHSVLENHTWSNRWNKINGIIESNNSS